MPQLSPSDGVFLVDDGSTDATGARVHAEFPSAHVINADGTLFWARGMRLAWETAVKEDSSFDYYLWLNDDVMLNPDALQSLLSDDSHCCMDCGVIVGACCQDESSSEGSYGATDLKDVRYIPNGGVPQKASGWFNGNVVLIPHVVYEQVGVISGDYRHARADYDYAERLKQKRIPFFCSSKYVGICRRDINRYGNRQGFAQRIAMLWRPSSLNLHDLWIYRCRYRSVAHALLSCAHLVLRVVLGL